MIKVGLREPTFIYIQDDLLMLHHCQELDSPLLSEQQILGSVLRQRDPLDLLVLHSHIHLHYTLNSAQLRLDASGIKQRCLHISGIPYIFLILVHLHHYSSNGITVSTYNIS